MSFQRLHFITGLPRSGSTLLAAIVRQNPRFHAAMSSPVAGIVGASLSAMGADNEFSAFLAEAQKRAILHGVFDGYYGALPPREVVFDTNRGWTARMPLLRRLYPHARFICCVRNPAWILDSVERLLRSNAFDESRLFSAAERGDIYTRAETLAKRDRLIGYPWAALREGFHGDDAGAMLLVDYDLLAAAPERTLELIHQFIGEPAFPYDFEHVEYEAEDFDLRLIARGLHTVTGRVEPKPRRTILPPDIFERFAAMEFWKDYRGSRAKVIVQQAAAPADPTPKPAPDLRAGSNPPTNGAHPAAPSP